MMREKSRTVPLRFPAIAADAEPWSPMPLVVKKIRSKPTVD
jgi:hypothetical protein